MKAYNVNINVTGRHGLNPEDSRGLVFGLMHGILRGLRKHFTTEDPYCLRRRLLRTVLKRIAVVAALALPVVGATGPDGLHHQHDNHPNAGSVAASSRT